MCFEAPAEEQHGRKLLATQENIHINLRHTTTKTPRMDQPALDVALDTQLQEADASSRIITAKKPTMQVMMSE
jgi:hypothetical protein